MESLDTSAGSTSESVTPVGSPRVSVTKERKYYKNSYMNYYVRLFDQEQFKGTPAAAVAKHAGRTWSAMSDEKKKQYRDMSLQAPKSDRISGRQPQRRSLRIQLMKRDSGTSGSLLSETVPASQTSSRTSIYNLVYSSSSSSSTPSLSTFEAMLTTEAPASQTIDSTFTREEPTDQTSDCTFTIEESSNQDSTFTIGEPVGQTSDCTSTIEESTNQDSTFTREKPTDQFSNGTSTRIRSIFSPINSSIDDNAGTDDMARNYSCTRHFTPEGQSKRPREAAITPRAPKRRRMNRDNPRSTDNTNHSTSTPHQPRRAKLDAIYNMSTLKSSRVKSRCDTQRLNKRIGVKRKLTFISDSDNEESCQPRSKRLKRFA